MASRLKFLPSKICTLLAPSLDVALKNPRIDGFEGFEPSKQSSNLKSDTVLPSRQALPEVVLRRDSVTAWETVRPNAFQSRQNLLHYICLCLEIS